MVQRVDIPRKNLEDLCKIYAEMSGGTVENTGCLTTYLNPAYFYRRNFITKPLEDDAVNIPVLIKEGLEKGNPDLTTFTKELLDASTEEGFHAAGFDTLAVQQHGMIFDKGTPFDHAEDQNIRLINHNELSLWVDTMIEGFREENKPREDIVYSNLIKSPKVFYLAYVYEGQIIGTAMLYLTDDYPGITEVAVPNTYRGKGIATKLIVKILQMVHEMDLPGAVLQASDMGMPVYEKLGFRKVSNLCTVCLRQ